jgi:hypothetical protein
MGDVSWVRLSNMPTLAEWISEGRSLQLRDPATARRTTDFSPRFLNVRFLLLDSTPVSVSFSVFARGRKMLRRGGDRRPGNMSTYVYVYLY